MQLRSLAILVAGLLMAASAALVACGNGDDNFIPPAKVPDASVDGTVGDSAAPEGGEAGPGEAGADAENAESGPDGEATEAGPDASRGDAGPDSEVADSGPDGE